MKHLKYSLISLSLVLLLSGCSNKQEDSIEEQSESEQTEVLEIDTNKQSDEHTKEENSSIDEIEMLEELLKNRKDTEETKEESVIVDEQVQNPVDITSGKVIDTDSIDTSMYNNIQFIDNNESTNFDYLALLYSTYNDILNVYNVYIPILTGTLQDNDSLKYSELDLSNEYYFNKLDEVLNTIEYRNEIIKVNSATDTDLLNKWNNYYKAIKSIENQLRELNENSSYKEIYDTLDVVTAKLAEALKIRTEDYKNKVSNLEENNNLSSELEEETEDIEILKEDQSSTVNIIE